MINAERNIGEVFEQDSSVYAGTISMRSTRQGM
jgi:hypothetical protein